MRPGDRQFQRPASHMSAVCVGKPACSKPLAFRKVALTPASTVPSQSDGKPNVTGSHFVVYFIPPTATPKCWVLLLTAILQGQGSCSASPSYRQGN